MKLFPGICAQLIHGGFLEEVLRILTLGDYNTRLVVITTSLLGMASGWIGSFLLLRKRSLMGDALSHACLPGIVLAFMVHTWMGGDGRSLPWLLAGAALAGWAGVLFVLLIRRTTLIKDDAAMGIVLSVGFGAGVVLMGMVQGMPGTSAAGLETFIYGKTASVVFQDLVLLVWVALGTTLACALLIKPFTLVCFDEGFAQSLGWSINRIDALMLMLVTIVTVAGLQSVGLILILAFLIIPAAAARFWTYRLSRMLWIAGGIGGFSGWLGSSLSALLPRLPAGAVIVIVAAMVFAFSLAFGTARGLLRRWFLQIRLRRKIERQHLLRAVFELLESKQKQLDAGLSNEPVSLKKLLAHRSWSQRELWTFIKRARRLDLVEYTDAECLRLSEAGFGEAVRITRNHRLWELFLIHHADIATSHVDRDADSVEHILSPEMVGQLEKKLNLKRLPDSPHPLAVRKARP